MLKVLTFFQGDFRSISTKQGADQALKNKRQVGVTEPTATFSACFGAPFMVWHPAKYAELLADKTLGKFAWWYKVYDNLGTYLRLSLHCYAVLNSNVRYDNVPYVLCLICCFGSICLCLPHPLLYQSLPTRVFL